MKFKSLSRPLWAKFGIVLAGGAGLLPGLTVLMGWHTHVRALVQAIPVSGQILLAVAGAALLGLITFMLRRARVIYKGIILIAIPLLFLLAFAGLAMRMERDTESAQAWSLHSKEVLAQAKTLQGSLVDAENSLRGYAITHNPRFNELYEKASGEAQHAAPRLQELVRDNPRQEASAICLAELTAKRMEWLSHVASMVLNTSGDAALNEIRTGGGFQNMNALRAELASFLQEEERLDAVRREAVNRSWERFDQLLIAGTSVAVLLAVVLSLLFGRGISQRLLKLTKNAQALAGGKEMTPPLGGTDEIARLDAVLHQVAGALNEAAEKERAIIIEQTARVEAEASERRYRQLADAMPQIVWTARPDGWLDFYNQRWFDYTGRTLAETEGWGWQPVLHPDDLQKCLELWNKSVETGEEYNIEYRFKRASDGTYRWHLGRAVPVRDENGQIVKWFGTCTDIDDQKRAEEELHKIREELEARVQQRTADLSTANKFLQEQIIERKRTEETLRRESNLLQALMDNIPDAIYFKDTNSRFTRVSRHVHLRGITKPKDAIGKTDFDFFTEEHARQAYEDEQRVIRTREPLIDKVEKETFPDGSVGWVMTTKVPIFDADGEVTGLVGASRDITERVRMEEELAQARDAALESARLKSEFLATMSHEIRTPMNGVIGMAGLLLDTRLGPEQREYAETIRMSADSLLTIINDILDFSKIEAGKLHFETLDFDLRGAVEGTVELLAEGAHAKRIELAATIPDDLPVQLCGDPGRLRQVLTNLVGNAIKFTRHGEVVVSVSKESETPDHAMIRFTVRDTGIGISSEAQGRLFQPFNQADGSTTREYGGTGLGLAISKQIVEMMGGEIGVESAPGKGSTFWFTALFEKQTPSASTTPVTRAELAGRRVLIVDDNKTNCRILMQQTGSWGMKAAEAESGAQALEMLRAAAAGGCPYELVVTDLQMPGMDGFELARAIKAAEKEIARARIVLLTSSGRRGHGERARAAGISGYLTKPIRQSQLFDCLAIVMSDFSNPEEPVTRASNRLVTQYTLKEARQKSGIVAVEKETAAPPSSRASKALPPILIAEDNVVNQKVAKRQVEKLGYRADLVANGLEALEALSRIPYALVLMDCQMPEMDGYQATAEIRRREGAMRHTPVIAMTANAMQGDREKCLVAGMDDYLSKPVKQEELTRLLARWLPEVETGKPATEERTSPASQDDTDAEVSAKLKELREEYGADLVVEIIEAFLPDTAQRLTALQQTIERADAQSLAREAHGLKGSCRNLGAQRMARLCETLERQARGGSLQNADRMVAQLQDSFMRLQPALESHRAVPV